MGSFFAGEYQKDVGWCTACLRLLGGGTDGLSKHHGNEAWEAWEAWEACEAFVNLLVSCR